MKFGKIDKTDFLDYTVFIFILPCRVRRSLGGSPSTPKDFFSVAKQSHGLESCSASWANTDIAEPDCLSEELSYWN
jgi:hypothetical protein